ncbi:MAG: pyridoxal phosphate-dependent aminotransferase [Rhodobacteraceae bacterium]|nr:pyridoxal phosphate-dependent aminotransferase [Paracoccaceae bacterium]
MGIFAKRLAGISPSPIAMLSQRARDLNSEGKEIIDLGVGEPDFDTPEFIKTATVEAMARGETKYTATNGSLALRKAISDKFLNENGLFYETEQIAVGVGAKQIIFNAFMATLDEGDEVVLPAPYWASYPDMVRIVGGVPVVVPCPESQGFLLTPDALEAAITPLTKWVVLNSPNNPSGAAYRDADLVALGDVLLRHPHVWILSDDIYEHLLYDGSKFKTIAQLIPDLYDRTVTMNGVSKPYAMTGWRLGYAGASVEMIRAMTNVLTQSTTHSSSLSQAGALAALTGPQDFIVERLKTFQERRDLVVSLINATTGLSARVPEGAFYVFPSCQGLIGRRRSGGKTIASDIDVSTFLLEDAGVSTVPGTLFGMKGFVRLSTAAATDVLRVACSRIHTACAGLT